MEIKKGSDSKYTLCTSDDIIENNINFDEQTINETQIKEIKSSDVDKEKQIILNEAKEHINRLFINERIKLSQKKREEIIFNFKILYLSIEDKFEIVANREMTGEKDQMLLKLYDIQKKKLKILKEFEKYIKLVDGNGKEIEKKLKEIKENIEK